jgi:carboxyl-terminal processing protease
VDRGVLLFFLLVALAAQAFPQQPAAPASAAATAASPSAQSDLSKRQEAFQIVWQTVNDVFYDPKFGGVNWSEVRERYQPQVAKVQSDRDFHLLLQQMLNELHQSHFMVVPRDSIPKIRAIKGQENEESDGVDENTLEDFEAEDAVDTLSYKLADRLLTGIGIDVRVLAGSAVVTRVEPGSPADRARFRPGFVIKQVGSRSLDSVISEIERHPQWGAIIRPDLHVFLVAGFINGDEASPVRIGYLDGRNRLRSITIKRERLKGQMSPAIGNLPAMYVEFDKKLLPGGIGYIRFSAFVPSLMERLCGAFRSMKDAPGIILDLRGNQGGLLGMIGGLTGLLEKETTLMGTMQMRNGRLPMFGFAQAAPYSGPLVILIDGSTQSAGEMFASGMKEAGRATLIGVKTAGNTLPSEIKKLPTGAIFQYGFANYETQRGNHLEGQGVDPDITVELSRRTLLRGGDPQLSAALRVLNDKIRGNTRGELIADVSSISSSTRVTGIGPRLPRPMGSRPSVSIDKNEEKPPPPVRANKPPAIVRGSEAVPGLPSVAAILDRYLEASGGQRALEKITSRVAIGTVEMNSLGVTGTVEFDDESPNKSSVIITAAGLGVLQRTFDGSHAWLQDPVQGIIRFTGLGLELMKENSIFNKPAKLKELFPSAVLMGKEKLGGKEVYVVRMGFEKWYFDTETGLLLRKGNVYYDDYREVDGIKLPFKLRDDVLAGAGINYQITEIKHNVKIDETKFVPYPSCFTEP